MRNRKTIFYLTMAAMGTAMLLPGNYAAAKEVGEETEIENVQETVIQSLAGAKQSVIFDISGKTAKFTIYVKGLPATKKISLTAKLQRYEDGKWKDVQSWEKAAEALSLNFAKTYSLSSKGNYRVQATVTYYQKDNSKGKKLSLHQ